MVTDTLGEVIVPVPGAAVCAEGSIVGTVCAVEGLACGGDTAMLGETFGTFEPVVMPPDTPPDADVPGPWFVQPASKSDASSIAISTDISNLFITHSFIAFY
jgi:hypothetical protein